MSIIVTFFTAPDDTSAALASRTGPGRAFESLSFGNFDPEAAVIEWECLLAGGSFEELTDAGEPRIISDPDNSGRLVFALSPRLCAALAGGERDRLRDVGSAWAEQRAADGEFIDPDVAHGILGDLASLASGSRGEGRGVYCWVA